MKPVPGGITPDYIIPSNFLFLSGGTISFAGISTMPYTALPTDGVSPLFQAVLEATEEAVYNSLLKATTVTAGRTTVEALPIDRVREILRKYNAGGR